VIHIEDWQKFGEVQRLLYRELYKKDFKAFVIAFWSECEPQKFIDGKVVQIFCEYAQYMARYWVDYKPIDITLPEITEDINIIDIRENKHNLNINIPPRHSKSIIFNVMFPVYIWINNPIKAASVSHTQGLAGEMNRKRQKILNSAKFKFFFPDITLTTNTAFSLIDDRGGELYSINREAFLGHGSDIIINDDITNAEAARKDKLEMASCVNYYRNTMPSRVNDPNKYVIMNIMQRLAPNDITGMILNDPALCNQYSFIVLPAIFKKETYVVCPISGDIIHFKKGDTLWPERFGDYAALRAQVGETVFETQYLQNPIATDSTVIKNDFIVERDACDVPGIEIADMVYASHDFPVKDKDTSDFLGSVLGYRVGSVLYIIDCLEKRMAFVDSTRYVKQLDTLYPGIIQVIEDKANGSPILQQLRDEVAGMQPFQPGTQSKMQRLESASLYMNSGNVVFVRSVMDAESHQYRRSESINSLIEKLLAFPFLEHDDTCDAFSMLTLFVFMDRRYAVYARSFNDANIVDASRYNVSYRNIFFNREGDIWKCCDIGIEYSEHSKIVVARETAFKATVTDGIKKLREFAPEETVFIDCSVSEGLYGMYLEDIIIEKYTADDFDSSVTRLATAFANRSVLIDTSCRLMKSDIDNFKFDKTKDDSAKYRTEKDGFVACLRTAMKYFGGIT